MKEISRALADAGVSLFHWIANLGPYSWNEIAFILLLIITAVVGVIAALSFIERRNRAIEFIDQSEVVTSPLRNRAKSEWMASPEAILAKEKIVVPINDTAAPVTPVAKPIQPLKLVTQPMSLAAPLKLTPIRAQLVLPPLSAGNANVREIAHANAITQRLKIVLAALAPYIEVAEDDHSFGKDIGLDRYTLVGSVRHMGDRIRLQLEMSDTKTGTSLFRFRYQGLPSEQDVMLAEITSRVLKATSGSETESGSNAA